MGDNGIRVQWTSPNTTSLLRYEAERSNDGRQFKKVAGIPVITGLQATAYSWLDETPVPGINFYRLKMIQADGLATYSSIIRINFKSGNDWHLFPNPVKGQVINLQLASISPANYQLTLYDRNGLKMMSRKLVTGASSTPMKIQLPINITPGTYLLQLTDEHMQRQIQQFIIEK